MMGENGWEVIPLCLQKGKSPPSVLQQPLGPRSPCCELLPHPCWLLPSLLPKGMSWSLSRVGNSRRRAAGTLVNWIKVEETSPRPFLSPKGPQIWNIFDVFTSATRESLIFLFLGTSLQTENAFCWTLLFISNSKNENSTWVVLLAWGKGCALKGSWAAGAAAVVIGC